MTKAETTLVRIGTPVERETFERLREIARSEDRSIAAVIRRAVTREIERQEGAAA